MLPERGSKTSLPLANNLNLTNNKSDKIFAVIYFPTQAFNLCKSIFIGFPQS